MIHVGYDAYSIADLAQLERNTRMLNLQHIDLHMDCWGAKIPDEKLVMAAIDLCARKGWTYVLNVEGAALGWDLPPALLDHASQSGLCRGVLLDECDWQQINAHWELPQTDGYRYKGQHYFGETEGLGLVEAYDKVYAEAARRNQLYLSAGLPRLASEHLYPVMMHTLARAGFAVSPKVLKETWGPVMLAVALGAAKQYDTDVWVCVDEWWHPELYGHPMKRYRSALLLAYWMGANVIHSEGGRFVGPFFDGEKVEEQGAILSEFALQYVPHHPRHYSFRDVRPSTAILRFDDTCFDIRQRTLGEYPGPLYGHIPAEAENVEWLTIWNAISHGYLRTDSITHNWETKLPVARNLFAPLNNVVVYDHLAGDRQLEGIDTIFLTGFQLSPETLVAVGRRVRAGATCITSARFLPSEAQARHMDPVTVIADGSGRWVVPADFYYLHYETWTNGARLPVLREALANASGREDTLCYQFADQQMTAQMFAADPDVLEFNLV